jgi:hypothetical protein
VDWPAFYLGCYSGRVAVDDEEVVQVEGLSGFAVKQKARR